MYDIVRRERLSIAITTNGNRTTTALSCLLILLLAGVLSACAAQRPILYPNAKLRSTGEARAQVDIDDCMALAESSGANDGRGAKVAKNTARNAAVGAGTGAVAGAIAGSAGKGAAIGAAGAGTATLIRGAFDANEPSQIFKRYVGICLQDQGYQLVGWR